MFVRKTGARRVKDRVIFHSDCNCFYASVEMHRHPELRGVPLCVGGHEESRHGIVLAKNPLAKAAGVKTGEALWQARQKCPGLVTIPPDYAAYQRYSRLARRIYYDYTDQVEPFGLDECWLDVTGSLALFGGDARLIANEISERVKAELGITVSVGASWNKVFAKFGSDADAGDGIDFITRENYREKVWPLPVEELIYVGRATKRKLNAAAVFTIGDLANASDAMLTTRLGKMGGILKAFARGEDASPVKVMDEDATDVCREVKSVGNGLTAPHDIVCPEDAKALIFLLAESVAQRLRELHVRAHTIAVGVRDARTLAGYVRQWRLGVATCITDEIAQCAFRLLRENEPLDAAHPLRALHVRASGLEPFQAVQQPTLFHDEEARQARERLDLAIDELRGRFGNTCVRRLVELSDEGLSRLDIKAENVIHPVGYFGD